MKRFILFIIILSFCIGIYFTLSKRNQLKQVIPPTPTPLPTQIEKPRTIQLNNRTYGFELFTVKNPQTISLIPNFDDAKRSDEIIKTASCSQAINAGFYDKLNRPLGEWKNKTGKIGESIDSALLNGYVSISNTNVSIAYSSSSASHTSFQTGPMLIFDTKILPLKIRNDEPERRMIAATTSSGQTVFFALFDPDSILRGPYLEDVPSLVSSISAELHLPITSAINLDGGSASAFYNGETSISEITPVGSLLCISSN
jgi:exopolysaccharide biosynthesis protein